MLEKGQDIKKAIFDLQEGQFLVDINVYYCWTSLIFCTIAYRYYVNSLAKFHNLKRF